jgi:hypothetical protein
MNKPRYDLAKAKRAQFRMDVKIVERANADLRLDDLDEVRKFIENAVKSLRANDFAKVELMKQRVGKPRYGDVYGKVIDDLVWFIKIEFEDGITTVVMSCHEAEHPLELANGRTLRPQRR